MRIEVNNMKALVLTLTTLLTLLTLEAVQASENTQFVDSSVNSLSVQVKGPRKSSPPQHFQTFKRHSVQQRRLQRRLPYRRHRQVFLQPYPGRYYRRYVRLSPSIKDTHYFDHESYVHDYPAPKKIRIRPSGTTAKPYESGSPSHIYVNSVSELEPIRTLPAEFVGPNGEYDEQGLAKQIILEMSQDPELKPLLETLEVTQHDRRVIFKGQVPSQALLDKVIAMSKTMRGIQTVETQQVTVLVPALKTGTAAPVGEGQN
jgi:hypothetical protein